MTLLTIIKVLGGVGIFYVLVVGCYVAARLLKR